MKTRSERPGLSLLNVTRRGKLLRCAVREEKLKLFSVFLNVFLGKSSENRKGGPSIWLAVFSAAPKMPTHFCVPLCTKKGYREEETGEVSYFKFPTEEGLRKL